MLDLMIKYLMDEEEEFGPVIHRLRHDQEIISIFIQYLQLGFEQNNSLILTQKSSPFFSQLNKIKELIFEAMEKIYVVDDPLVINMCVCTVLASPSNEYSSSVEQMYVRCLELLVKNVDFNHNYPQFNLILIHLLSKCLILCKSTTEELMTIETDPEKFVEATEDFCDTREEYSIRMRSA